MTFWVTVHAISPGDRSPAPSVVLLDCKSSKVAIIVLDCVMQFESNRRVRRQPGVMHSKTLSYGGGGGYGGGARMKEAFPRDVTCGKSPLSSSDSSCM